MSRLFELSEIWQAYEETAKREIFKSTKIHIAPEKAYCSRCNSQIAWVVLTNDKKHPLNWLCDGRDGNVVYSRADQKWRVLRPVEIESLLRLGGWVVKSHFETCPFADEFRRKKK